MAKTILELWKEKFSGDDNGANVTASNFYSSGFADSSEADSFDYNQVRNQQNVGNSTYAPGATYGDTSVVDLESSRTGNVLYDDELTNSNSLRSGLIARYMAYRNGVEIQDNPDTVDINEEEVELKTQFEAIDSLLASQIAQIANMKRNYDDLSSS